MVGNIGFYVRMIEQKKHQETQKTNGRLRKTIHFLKDIPHTVRKSISVIKKMGRKNPWLINYY